MWLFTIYGFFSVSVQSGRPVVRARLRQHLEALQKRFPDLQKYELQEIDTTDYRFRLKVAAADWENVVLALTREQTWSNFKNQATQVNGHDAYVEALHEIWHVLV